MEVALTISAPQFSSWSSLTLLLLLTTSYQIVALKITGHPSDHAQLFFFAAGMLLLPPSLFALLVLLTYLGGWGKGWWTTPWLPRELFPQLTLVAAHILAGVAAHAMRDLLCAWLATAFLPHSLILAGLAILIYVASYRLCLDQAWTWLPGLSGPAVELWQVSSLFLDCMVMVLGYVLVLLWQQNGWLLLPALAPLGLMTQLLRIPQLEKVAQTDAKTGLLDAAHWRQQVQAELVRAHYFKHPLCLILVDLDDLRTINNTYGHLAGDAVIVGVAQILQHQVREYAIVGRFGGEEFALVLPETGAEQAQTVAERLRCAIESTAFAPPAVSAPLRATACFGVATFPDAGDSLDQLIHQADVALYQAKARGKNCVVCAGDLAVLTALAQDTLPSAYQAAFALSAPRRP